MTELASSGQLRAAVFRWSLVTVPGTLLLGYLSSQFGSAQSTWFEALVKPEIYPPPATFGVVWTMLYWLMGLALALIIAARGARGRGLAIFAWVLQLMLNLAWSPLFFGAHQITLALWLLVVLDVAVLATTLMFWRVRPVAAAMLLPYLGWVLFATLLNYEFLRANPDADGKDVSGAVSRIEI